MPSDDLLPHPDGLSEKDLRALGRFVSEGLDQGFRLAIVEAPSHAARATVLQALAPAIGPGLCRIAVDELPGAEHNLLRALRPVFANAKPRCLALWGIESKDAPDWPQQLNVQRDPLAQELAVPWILFIHPATRVRLLLTAPDFCDFAMLWLRDDRTTAPTLGEAQPVQTPPDTWDTWGASSVLRDVAPDVLVSPLLQQALEALEQARFDQARDLLFQVELQRPSSQTDRLAGKLIAAHLDIVLGHLAAAEAQLREVDQTLQRLPRTPWTDVFSGKCLLELAEIRQREGNYAEAETLVRRSLSILEQTLGPNHRHVARGLDGLAHLLQAQGKLGEAETLYRRSLSIREKTLGPNHPDVAQSLNNLANLLQAQGKLGEAAPLYRRSLSIREQTLGPNHPDVAQSLNNLAHLLKDQGKLAEAEPLYQRSIQIFTQSLGPEHPRTKVAIENLQQLQATPKSP